MHLESAHVTLKLKPCFPLSFFFHTAYVESANHKIISSTFLFCFCNFTRNPIPRFAIYRWEFISFPGKQSLRCTPANTCLPIGQRQLLCADRPKHVRAFLYRKRSAFHCERCPWPTSKSKSKSEDLKPGIELSWLLYSRAHRRDFNSLRNSRLWLMQRSWNNKRERVHPRHVL